MMALKMKDFTFHTPRPLPVILLADVSGSMEADGKIDALNLAIEEMLKDFSEEAQARSAIIVGIITFGGDVAVLHTPMTPVGEIKWKPLIADGRTPLGHAFELALNMIEDRSVIPGRAYRPTVILVSDGQATDDWEDALERFLLAERASKAYRFAMAIGEDADMDILQAFCEDSAPQVFTANDARAIRQFFRWVTMSVSTRSQSINPDSVAISPLDMDKFEF